MKQFKQFLFVVLAVAVLALVVPSVAHAMGLMAITHALTMVEAPQWLIILVTAGIGWLVTEGLKDLSNLFPWIPNLQDKATAITAALVASAIYFINNLLAAVPVDYEPAVLAAFSLIAAILAMFGIARTFRRVAPSKPVVVK